MWSPNSLQILKTIARRSSLRSGVSNSRAVADLHGRLSLRLWHYNARMVLDRSSLLGLDGDSLFSSCDWYIYIYILYILYIYGSD